MFHGIFLSLTVELNSSPKVKSGITKQRKLALSWRACMLNFYSKFSGKSVIQADGILGKFYRNWIMKCNTYILATDKYS